MQARLAKSAERVAGQAAKTRKHVGSSIYRCGVCGHTLHIQGGKGGSYVCPNNRLHPRVEGEKPSGPVCVLIPSTYFSPSAQTNRRRSR